LAGQIRTLSVVEADRDDIEVAIDLESRLLDRTRRPFEDLTAQHRAAVVDQRQYHRLPLAEELSEQDGITLFIDEREAQIDLVIEPLIDLHVGRYRIHHPVGLRREGVHTEQ